jgi:hypothetical protein
MPKYVIERNIPGAGNMDADDLSAASAKSCGVLNGLGNNIQWIHSYVTGGFPANSIAGIKAIIDPTRARG